MRSIARSITLALLVSAFSVGASPWTYRGSLNDGGQPANGRYDIRLSLLDAGGAKSLAYPQTFSGVAVKDGSFAIDVDFGLDLTQFGVLKLKTEVQQGGSGFVALGEAKSFDPKAALAGVCWDTQGNALTNATTDFLGTTDAQPLVLRTGNARSLRIEPSSILSGGFPITTNSIGGSFHNAVTAGIRGATIAGGGSTNPDADPDFAGAPNTVSDHYGTVGGGNKNRAGNDTGSLTDGAFATVAGGFNNVASGTWSSISGGSGNTASGTESAVTGGGDNSATEFTSIVSGGKENRSSGTSSSVAGGQLNQATGAVSAVIGGAENCAGADYTLAAGRKAKVRPFVGADTSNFACAGVPTGGVNGDQGTFAWADSQNADFISTGPNQFLVRASGGVGINDTPPGANGGFEFSVYGNTPDTGFVEFSLIPKLSLNGNTGERIELGVGAGGAGSNDASFRIAHRNNVGGYFERLLLNADGSVQIRSSTSVATQGVSMAAGAGAWSSLSDRSVKTAIAPTDTRVVLDRLVAMPVSEWSYLAQGDGVRHIGPMAQDFKAAFGMGENDTTISTVDADGVALAAIQGLNAKLESENAALRAALAELADRLAALEAAKER
jgi:trimeric autotransporter adhesin